MVLTFMNGFKNKRLKGLELSGAIPLPNHCLIDINCDMIRIERHKNIMPYTSIERYRVLNKQMKDRIKSIMKDNSTASLIR